MIPIKEFTTAAKAALAEDEGFGFDVEVKIDKGSPKERTVTFHKPSEGQITLFMAMAGDDLMANTQVVAQTINFLYSLLETNDAAYFRRRLFDMNDDFGAQEVAEIMTYVMEEWTGKDSGSPTGSRPSQRRNGSSSTTRQRATR